MPERTSFLVDGFNVYHSLLSATEDLRGKPTKWLDLNSLLRSYLYLLGSTAVLEEIYYFSALAHHVDARKPGVTTRHRNYIACLEATGIRVELGRFKKKDVRCPRCRQVSKHREEKETDVAISVKLLELFARDRADTIIIVSGDTDLAPAVRATDRLYPSKRVGFGFPYRRTSKELTALVPLFFTIRKEAYLKHRLADPFPVSQSRSIAKPSHW